MNDNRHSGYRADHKRVRHYDEPGHCHELTFSCYQRRPLLTNDRWRGMLSQSLDRACHSHNYHLIAFVYMPEHVHLLVHASARASPVAALLGAIKRPLSYRIKRLLIASRGPLLETLTIQQRPGVSTFRFWQEGPGYDRNLCEPRAIQAAMEYIHQNPVRRGLCEQASQWRWSSAAMLLEPDSPLDPLLPKLASLPPELFEV